MKLYSLFVISFFILSCSNNQQKNNDQIVFANFRDLRDLNPHLYQGEMWAQEMLYDTLVSIEDNGIQAALAESWEITDSGKTYSFKIRKDMKFADGESLDAYAIEKNFDAIWNNKERHIWLGSMKLITGYEAIDKNTFIITLSEPYYPLLTELGVTRPFAMISPKAMIDGNTKDGVTAYIGSGAYTLLEVKPKEYAIFERNTNYWGKQPKINRVMMKVIPDNHARVFALNRGEVDLIFGADLLDVDTLNEYKNKKGYVARSSNPISTRHLVLNTAHPVLMNQQIRYALSHAIDKKNISEGIFYGIEPIAEYLYDKSIPYANVELEPFEYNPQYAEKILIQDGWIKDEDGIYAKEHQRLQFTILYDINSVAEKTISEYLQSEFSKIGVAITLAGLERQAYFDALKQGDFDIAHNIAWGLPYDPQSSLSSMRGPAHGDYAAQKGLTNKQQIYDAITDVFTTVDEDKRQEIYDYILTSLHESAVYIPLTYKNNKTLYTDRLTNVLFKISQYRVSFEEMEFLK